MSDEMLYALRFLADKAAREKPNIDEFDKVETLDASTGKWRVCRRFYYTFRQYLNKFKKQFWSPEYPSFTAELDKLAKNLAPMMLTRTIEYARFLPADYFEQMEKSRIRELKQEFCDGLWEYLTITRTKVGPERFKYMCELTIVLNSLELEEGQ